MTTSTITLTSSLDTITAGKQYGSPGIAISNTASYIVYGDGNADTINFASSLVFNSLWGGGNNTVITGSSTVGNNLYTGGGNETVTGGAGNDNITVTAAGNTVIKDGNGNDNISVNALGTDNITVGYGKDVFSLGDGSNTTINVANVPSNVSTPRDYYYLAGDDTVTSGNAPVTTATINTSSDNNYFQLGSGSSASISNFGGSSDDISVSAAQTIGNLNLQTAKAVATLNANWTATSLSTNNGLVNLSTNGFNIDLSSAKSGTGLWNITSTGKASFTSGANTVDYIINSNTSNINDLGNNSSNTLNPVDILNVNGATVNATLNANGWTASSASFNKGTANINTAGYNLDVSNASKGNAWNIVNTDTNAKTETITAGITNDTLNGSASNDNITFNVNGNGNVLVTGSTGQNTYNINGSGNDTLLGSSTTGLDIFNIAGLANTKGQTTITNLNGTDSLAITNAKEIVNATVSSNWVATSSSINQGAVNIYTAGHSVDLSALDNNKIAGNGWYVQDTLSGTSNQTSLTGSAYNDTLIGGNGGSNTLTDNGGTDVLTGGGNGALNTYIINAGVGNISNFNASTDNIQVNNVGATANATLNANWTLTSKSSNAGQINLSDNGHSIDLRNAAAGDGLWQITNTGGNDSLWGGTSADSYNILSGTSNIEDLGNKLSNPDDVLNVKSGAAVNATINSLGWTAASTSANNGNVNISTAGYDVDVSNTTGSHGWNILNTDISPTTIKNVNFSGGVSNDTLSGGKSFDSNTFNINGNGIVQVIGGLGLNTIAIGTAGQNGSVNITSLHTTDVLENTNTQEAVNATVSGNWTAGSNSINDGTVNIYTAGYNVDISSVKKSNGWTVKDTASGGSNNVTLTGGNGNSDTLIGGNGGSNTLIDNGGADTLVGGQGANNTFEAKSSSDASIQNLGAGNKDVIEVLDSSSSATATLVNNWTATVLSTNLGSGRVTLNTTSYNIDLSAINTGQSGWEIDKTTTASDTLKSDSAFSDLFNITAGTSNISNFGSKKSDNSVVDDLQLRTGAIANVTLGANGWVADQNTQNNGKVTITTAGHAVDLSNITSATNANQSWVVTDTGAGTTLTGGADNITLIGGNTSNSVSDINILTADGTNTLIGGAGTAHNNFVALENATAAITNLTGTTDSLTIANGATVNATLTGSWSATSNTSNGGTVNLTTNGYNVDLSKITNNVNTNGWTINSTGNDTLTGDGNADTYNITAGNSTITNLGDKGGSFSDTLKIAKNTNVTATINGNNPGVTGWTATAASVNNGTVKLNTLGSVTVDVSNAQTGNGWTITNTDAGNTNQTVTFDSGNNNDTLVGGTSTDTNTFNLEGTGNDSVTGGLGANIYNVTGAGNETIVGGLGTINGNNNVYNINNGTVNITKNFGTANLIDYQHNDDISVKNGAIANVTVSSTGWIADANSSNQGVVNLFTNGYKIDVSGAASTTTKGWYVKDTGNGTTLIGGNQNDTLIGGNGGQNILTGGTGTDVLTGGNGATNIFNDTNGSNYVMTSGSGGANQFNITNTNVSANIVNNASNVGITATINNFASGNDTLKVSANVTANVTLANNWAYIAAGSNTGLNYDSNAGIVNLTTSGHNIDLSKDTSTTDVWTLTSIGGTDNLTGNQAIDSYTVSGGTSNITSLGNKTAGADILNITAPGIANVTINTAGWTATASTSNSGTANIYTAGYAVDVSKAGGTKGWVIKDTGLATSLTGGANNDILIGGNNVSNSVFTNTLTDNGGTDTLTGGSGTKVVNNYVINSGTATITNLGAGIDSILVNAGAIVNATLTNQWSPVSTPSATNTNTNTGTINLYTNGISLDLSKTQFQTSNVWNIVNTGGSDNLTGSSKQVSYTVKAGTSNISNLGNKSNGTDVLIVNANATANATIATNWTASSTSSNSGTANITTQGLAVDLSAITLGTKGWKITDTGAGTTLTSSHLNDTLIGGNSGTNTLIVTEGTDQLTGGVAAPRSLAVVNNTYIINNNGVGNITNFNYLNDTIKVNSVSAIANVNISANGNTLWTVSSSFVNDGTVNLITAGVAVDDRLAQGTGAWYIKDTGQGTTLTSGAGNDTLIGGNGGTNTLNAGTGADSLVGGNGATNIFNSNSGDTLTGGSGATNTFNITTGTDYISNLAAGTDKLNVSTNAIANATLANNWTYTTASTNAGSVYLSTKGYNIDLSKDTSTSDKWIITSIGGTETLIGNQAQDSYSINAGIANISNLGTKSNGADILNVASGIANVSLSSAWTASSNSNNAGTVNISTAGFAVDISKAGGTGGWSLKNTSNSTGTSLTGNQTSHDTLIGGNHGGDTLTGASGLDEFIVNGNNDVLNGVQNSDVLQINNNAKVNLTLTNSWTAGISSNVSGALSITATGTVASPLTLNLSNLTGNNVTVDDTTGGSTIYTQSGSQSDVIHIEKGTDNIIGFNGNDTIDSGTTGTGTATLWVSGSNPALGNASNAQLSAVTSFDAAANKTTINISKTTGNVSIYGGTIFGNTTINNTFIAGSGNDSIYGAAGDTITAGIGNDIFLFNSNNLGLVTFTKTNNNTYSSMVTVKNDQLGKDIFNYNSGFNAGGYSGAAVATTASIDSYSHMATFSSNVTNLQQAIAQLVSAFATTNTPGTQLAATDKAGEFALFQLNKSGDEYLFISSGGETTANTTTSTGNAYHDILIDLSNVTGQVTASYSGTNLIVSTEHTLTSNSSYTLQTGDRIINVMAGQNGTPSSGNLDTLNNYKAGAVGTAAAIDYIVNSTEHALTIGTVGTTDTALSVNQTNGVITFNPNNPNVTNLTTALTEIVTGLATSNNGTVSAANDSVGEFVFFRLEDAHGQSIGNEYLFISSGNETTISNHDTLISLTGLTTIATIDLTGGNLSNLHAGELTITS